MKLINLVHDLLEQHQIRRKMYNDNEESEDCSLPGWAVGEIQRYTHQQWLIAQPNLKFKCKTTGKVIDIYEPSFDFIIYFNGKVEYTYQRDHFFEGRQMGKEVLHLDMIIE